MNTFEKACGFICRNARPVDLAVFIIRYAEKQSALYEKGARYPI